MARIAIITIGVVESPILSQLLSLPNIEFDIICSNILDFELPPKIEQALPIYHRHELRNVLRQIGAENFEISNSLINLLRENDRLNLDDTYLGVTSHISQIEQNSKDLIMAYNLLLRQTGKENIRLIPLSNKESELTLFKSKKYAPLRYYYLQHELLPNPPKSSKRKHSDKKLSIEGLENLTEMKLTEEALEALENSDLIVILPTDIISLGVLVRASELEKQIKNVDTPLVLIWPFDSDEEMDQYDMEISTLLNLDLSLPGFAEDLSALTDYVLINKKEKNHLNKLREAGCYVLLSEFKENGEPDDELIKTVLNVADLGHILDGNDQKEEEPKIETKQVAEEKVQGKKISQLVESPEEAGIEKIKDTVDIEVENDKEEEIADIIENLEKAESEEERMNETLKLDVASPMFIVKDDEDWIDSVKRAIELSMNNDDTAQQWLIDQSTGDSDNEVRIAELLVNAWIQSRSQTYRKEGAKVISMLSKLHRDTYLQIMERHMLQAILEKQEDKRRTLIPLFSMFYDIDFSLSEDLIRAIIKDLASIPEGDEVSRIEFAKITILQLVIQSRRLSRIAIGELLKILEAKPEKVSSIWNILIAFDAGMVALELVTNFSVSKVEELIRRANLLRFTGSYYTTIIRVLEAWKSGDKQLISTTTGTIIPEETLRKFERLELARKLNKLGMVQLTTLAESLGKDVETVERLITELIVNDELKAELKLVDDKMYLVSTSNS